MKKNFLLLCLISFVSIVSAQTTSTTSSSTSAAITDLAVPNSPAFSITDITPTLVQSPTTPKAFALGIAQSFQQSGTGFPNNYSAEFAPIWWINPKAINVYSYFGVPRPGVTDKAVKPNIFAGLKFTTVSIAFINKDLIPDTSKATQNVFSIGVHTTLIKIYGKDYNDALTSKLTTLSRDIVKEEDLYSRYIDSISRLTTSDPDYTKKVKAILTNYQAALAAYKGDKVFPDLTSVNKLIAEKPSFSWDIAGAWAVYGINNNQQIRTGRAGVWTSLASYIPLDPVEKTNYFNINLLGRYLLDNFQQNAQGVVGTANNIDVGGNLGFEFSKLSIAVESLYRFINGVPNKENRTVGVISVKLTDKIFINGTFGKDFAGPNKLISAFGINWGLGNEQVSLP